MSSSNLVSVISIDEATYGKTPDPTGGITADTARFTSESLSGTPQTTASAAIRTDRMSGGQVVTGLDVGGDLNFELASDAYFDKFFALGMMSTWSAASTAVTGVSFTPDAADDQKGLLAGTGVGTGLAVGDLLKVTSGTDVALFSVISITDADNLVVASKRGQASITAGSSSRPQFLDIGSTINSVTLAKAYKDVTHGATTDEHGQEYSGSIVSGFNISAQYGQIVTGAFSTVGNGYMQESGPSLEQQVVTGGGTINPAGTSNPLNASVDVPLVVGGTEATTWCVESFNLSLANNETAQNCIGKIAPTKYDIGECSISVDMNVYNSDPAYDFLMPAKLTQQAIAFTFVMINGDGGYAFHVPSIQLSFEDPSAGGASQPVMLNASGQAKVGPGGTSALRIYKL